MGLVQPHVALGRRRALHLLVPEHLGERRLGGLHRALSQGLRHPEVAGFPWRVDAVEALNAARRVVFSTRLPSLCPNLMLPQKIMNFEEEKKASFQARGGT